MSNTSKGFEEKGSKYWMQVLVNLDNINGIPLDDYKKSEKYKPLDAKLQEEVNEFLEDMNLEELADVMEVLFGLAYSLGYSEEKLLKARVKKRE
ncbi:MAG: hypothetical protein ABF685_25680 [Clostridium saccharoperbutylacetonicum]